ncbi:LysR family transcriptional regulator [Streptomyces sp. NBC_01264]|uniref:LysR family transcriptional regulator n=1 Tax=Streptomyces sp. NBC_01264 TaxID=2903804 RepID=UPI00224E0CCA|nr:LysR family transcriptional regulator [Streptomyces sp. NBC_01264]MCX4775714.1 LysR family transcriptional regulator [Streptomyces sp. NBC_01264]
MDLDLAQARAFVLTAQEMHFGRAATTLSISQQALSKRIARLESALGAELFDRGGHGVRLTEAGRRFLEPARGALAAADRALAAVREERRPLRVDVWGHLYAPMRTLAQLTAHAPEPALERGHGRDLPSVAAGLLHGETDAAFGRVHPPLPEGLTHRLVRLEPVDVVLGADHPLAGEAALRPGQLAGSVLWTPGALDRLDFLHRFAERFAVREHAEGPNLGADHFLAGLSGDVRRFALMPADAPLPRIPGIRSVPLVDPTPLYAWSLLWRGDGGRGDGGHPLLDTLLEAFAAEAGRSRWLEYDPARDWLPEPGSATTP